MMDTCHKPNNHVYTIEKHQLMEAFQSNQFFNRNFESADFRPTLCKFFTSSVRLLKFEIFLLKK